MIGPAELEDILLDVQAAAADAGVSLQTEDFHPSFLVLPQGLDKPRSAEEPAGFSMRATGEGRSTNLPVDRAVHG
jgi:hypothetical protein